MQIQCPACKSRASIPDGKEGAKVRCQGCQRVFVARPLAGSRGARTASSTGPIIGVALAAAAVVALLVVSRMSGRSEPQAREPVRAAAAAATEELGDELGWDSPAVQTAVRAHEHAAGADETRLKALLFGERIWAREAEDDASRSADAWVLMTRVEQDAELARWAAELMRGDDRELVADWRPYDGEVVALTDTEATVRLAVSPRAEGGVDKRTVEWRLAKDGEAWKAFSWERWISPDEELALRREQSAKAVVQTTLSDGSVVLEREPEPLEHLADTPQELRDAIDRLYATMIDLNLTREASAAQRDLVAIGKPAIPILLTGLYEIPLDTQENAIKCNLIVQTLRQITGEYMGYKPQVAEGSGTGTTDERRSSAIKQWFAWWYKNEKKFTEKKEQRDGLEGLIELTEKERAKLARDGER